MSTHKYIDLICVAVLVCTLLVTVLFINGERLGIQAVVDGDSAESSDSAYFTRNDRNGAWDPAGATEITLLGDHARISGGGAYAYDNKVVLAQAGRYRVSGALEDGTLVDHPVQAGDSWYVLFVEDAFDEEATQDKKEEIVEQRKDDAIEAVYEEWESSEDETFEFDSKTWTSLLFDIALNFETEATSEAVSESTSESTSESVAEVVTEK